MRVGGLHRPALALGVVLIAALCSPPPAAKAGPWPDLAQEASRKQWQMPIRVMDEVGRNLLGNLAKGLKPDGRLVIVDWDPVKLQQATAPQFEPELRRTLRLLEDAGFGVVKTLDFLPRQSLRICKWRHVD